MAKKEEAAKKKSLKKELEKFNKNLEAALKSLDDLPDFDNQNKAQICKTFLSGVKNKLASHLSDL